MEKSNERCLIAVFLASLLGSLVLTLLMSHAVEPGVPLSLLERLLLTAGGVLAYAMIVWLTFYIVVPQWRPALRSLGKTATVRAERPIRNKVRGPARRPSQPADWWEKWSLVAGCQRWRRAVRPATRVGTTARRYRERACCPGRPARWRGWDGKRR